MTNYYEPTDSLVGLLERRMLYLVNDMTFEEYFERPYNEVLLDNHVARIQSMPPHLQDPTAAENLADTKSRIDKLGNILLQPKYKHKHLARLCQTVSSASDPALWDATKPVVEKKIFVPYFHSCDHAAASDVFGKYGFLNPRVSGGWAEDKISTLFENSPNDVANHPHPQKRLMSLKKAKEAYVVRPHPGR